MNHETSGIMTFARLAGVSVSLFALALAVGGGPLARAGGGKKQESQVKLSATASKVDADGHQVVTVIMDINSGWHAYANPVEFDQLENAQTVVKITSANKLQEVKINYPAGKRHVDGKDSFFIYEGKVEIQATVKRAPGDTGPLDVSVKFMTCNDKTCLPPEQVKLQVK
jgi:DsbC/DsbD-like thiol-disulfide interchange protein